MSQPSTMTFDGISAKLQALIQRADDEGLRDPNAMTLSTVSADGQPSARVVLLKQCDARGFVFYTNLTSHKGREALGQGKVCLSFYWRPAFEQVRVQGFIERVDAATADAYFASRPRPSQLGAWASLQSQPLDARATLEARVEEFKARFEGQPVPRPEHWSGLRVVPRRVEFWIGDTYRLHDRTIYTRQGDDADVWTEQKLYP